MKKIYKIDEIPERDKIFLSKDILGWRVVYPYRNEDGSINWFNFIIGGWSNLLQLLFWVLLVLMFFFAYKEIAAQLTSCLHPVVIPFTDVPAGTPSWQGGFG